MHRSPPTNTVIWLAIACLLLATPRALHAAYLDPGTGSLIAQLLAAFIFGGIATLKMSGRKLRNLFSSTAGSEEKGGSDPKSG